MPHLHPAAGCLRHAAECRRCAASAAHPEATMQHHEKAGLRIQLMLSERILCSSFGHKPDPGGQAVASTLHRCFSLADLVCSNFA